MGRSCLDEIFRILTPPPLGCQNPLLSLPTLDTRGDIKKEKKQKKKKNGKKNWSIYDLCESWGRRKDEDFGLGWNKVD